MRLDRFSFQVVLVLSLLTACGGNSDNTGVGNNVQDTPYVAFEKIPSKYNPEVLSDSVATSGAEKIDMNLYSFDKDVRVVYSADLADGQAIVRRYTVWYEQANFGQVASTLSGKTVSINNYTNGGFSSCSIRVTNGEITELKGGCYVRVELVLPQGSQIEVYNLHQLISRRFLAMDNKTFLERFDDASFAKDKLAVIEEFLSSYEVTGKTPTLLASELGQVTEDFPFKDEKLTGIRRLGRFVSDRQNLEEAVISKFSYFDQNEAREILGLPQKSH